MGRELLNRKQENTIRITAEFLEDGYILKSGRSSIHRYDLDLMVRNDITLNELLGAVYAGLRKVLEKDYKLKLTDNLAGIIYQDLQDPFAFRAADGQRGSRRLRPRIANRVRLRVDAMRYRDQRRKLADLEARYPMIPDDSASMSPEQKERLGWIVCWQVFHECYRAYATGYPDREDQATADEVRAEEYLCHPVIARSSVDLQSDADGAYYGTARHPQLQLVRDRDGEKTLRELGFLTSTRLIFDPVLWHHSAALYDSRKLDPTIGEKLPYYTPGDDPKEEPDLEEVSIQPLTEPPRRPDIRQTPQLLLPPLMMLAVILAILGFTGGLRMENALMIFVIMLSATLLTGLLSWLLYWLGYRMALGQWIRPYEAEIRQTLRELVLRQEHDSNMMQQAHPPACTPEKKTDLVHQILEFNGELFTTVPGDWDFLKARLGLSAAGSGLVPSVFPVTGVNGEGAFSDIRYKHLRGRKPESFRLVLGGCGRKAKREDPNTGPLSSLPEDIAREYGSLLHAPVLLDLKAPAVGLVFRDRTMSFDPLLDNLVLDLCFHHSPEHLQFVMLCPENGDWKARHDKIRKYKHLPHFDELLKDRSAFAFSKKEAWELFDQLQTIQTERRSKAQPMPHIIVLVQEEYDLRDHPLAANLPDSQEEACADVGITFLFCKNAERELPPRCANVVVADPGEAWFLLPSRYTLERRTDHRDRGIWGRYRFEPDPMLSVRDKPEQKNDAERLLRAFKILSAICRRKQDRSRVPVRQELFSLLTYPDPMPLCYAQTDAQKQEFLTELYGMIQGAVQDNWSLGLTDTLEVPIGVGEEGVVSLDLHERQAGPHLLIAGDAKTGKTSGAAAYFHILGMLYGPQTLALIPVDLQARGLAEALKALPHTMQDMVLQGGGRMEAVEYLRSLIRWLDDEILSRRQRFSQSGAGGFDDYLRSSGQGMKRIFVVLDDFDALAHMVREYLDLPGEISRLIRDCEELGIHLVLITDRLEPSISQELLDQITARICLRMSDPEAAEQIMYTDAPARAQMPGNGRAYLRGSAGTMAEYFQMACGSADIGGSAYAPFHLVLAAAGGSYSCFFDSENYVPPLDEDADAWDRAVQQPIHVVYSGGPARGKRKSVRGDDRSAAGASSDGHGDRRQGDQAPADGHGDRRQGNQAPTDGHGDRRQGNQTPADGHGDRRQGDQAPTDGHGDRRQGDQAPTDGHGDRRQGDQAPSGAHGDGRWDETVYGGSYGDDRQGDQAPSGAHGDDRWDETVPGGGHGDDRWGDPYYSGGSGYNGEGTRDSGTETGNTWGEPGKKWKDSRGGSDRSENPHRPWENAPRDADWRERYFRRWRAYDYNHVPPNVETDFPAEPEEWVRPDEALLRPVQFSVSQQAFAARVMREHANRNNRTPVPQL